MTTIVAFPTEISRLADLRRAYIKECERYHEAEVRWRDQGCKGPGPRFKWKLTHEYYEARRAVAELNVAIAIPLVPGAEPRIEPGEKIADFPSDLALDK